MGRETNDCDNWDFTEESLDDYLAKFWFGARKNVQDDSEEESQETEDPELKCRMYKANSLKITDMPLTESSKKREILISHRRITRTSQNLKKPLQMP